MGYIRLYNLNIIIAYFLNEGFFEYIDKTIYSKIKKPPNLVED